MDISVLLQEIRFMKTINNPMKCVKSIQYLPQNIIVENKNVTDLHENNRRKQQQK